METTCVSSGAFGHEAYAVNELTVSGGKVCRIGLTYNNGFTDPALTTETIRDRTGDVLNESTARVWTSATSRYEGRARES